MKLYLVPSTIRLNARDQRRQLYETTAHKRPGSGYPKDSAGGCLP